MKLARVIADQGHMAVVVAEGERLLDVSPLLRKLGLDGRAIPLDQATRRELRRRLPMEEEIATVQAETFLPPISSRQILAIGLNYRSHAEEMNSPLPEEPIVFAKSPSSVVGHRDTVCLPGNVGRVDYEAEVAVVIGRRASHLKAEEAGEVISGYSLLNDVTMRDVQGRASAAGRPWFLAKSPDTFCPFGPFMVGAEDVSEPENLDFTLTLNGEVRQNGSMSDLIFSVPELLEYITRFITLEPGDIIATGTPSGVGPIKPGDFMAIESPVLGTLENPVS